jgi:hypothetical protein
MGGGGGAGNAGMEEGCEIEGRNKALVVGGIG